LIELAYRGGSPGKNAEAVDVVDVSDFLVHRAVTIQKNRSLHVILKAHDSSKDTETSPSENRLRVFAVMTPYAAGNAKNKEHLRDPSHSRAAVTGLLYI
jgi:hypothetical protein